MNIHAWRSLSSTPSTVLISNSEMAPADYNQWNGLIQHTMSADTNALPSLTHLQAENCRLALEVEQLSSQLAACRIQNEQELGAKENHLRQKTHDLRSILDHMPAMIGYWDTKLRNRFGNHAYKTWFGIEPSTMPGMHIRDVIGEERYQLNLPYIEAALRGEPQKFERAIPTPDGTQVRYSLAEYLPDIIDEQVVGFYVLVSDITEAKEAAAALQSEKKKLHLTEDRYRAMLEAQTDLISRIREDGTFIFVNDVYCQFFGKTAEELTDRLWHPVAFPDDLPLIEAALATLSASNPIITIENRVYSGTGEIRWMSFINRGFFDERGRLLEFQSVGRDITDRKRAEMDLQRAHEKLEEIVKKRTESLRRLTVETTLAEERERQAIARDLHDDLGQLLHIMKIKQESLGKHLPEVLLPRQAELNELIATASSTVRSLTSQLSPPVLKRLGLIPALHWLGEEMQRQYGLTVDFCSPAEASAPTLSAAQSAILFRAVRELLINVVKHSHTGHAKLTLCSQPGQFGIAVEDAGTGIADIGTILVETGGFGLASIRERLIFLGGDMDISTPGQGGLRIFLRVPLDCPDDTFQ